MATLKAMYPAQANSPETTIIGALTAGSTTITVLDGSVLPVAPNILTIGADSTLAETVLVTAKNGDTLTVERGYNGTTARSWEQGSSIGRYFTGADHDALRENIDILNRNKADLTDALTPSNIKAGDGIAVSVSGSNVTISTSGPAPIPGISKTLNNNTWPQISQVSDALLGPNYWAIGDCKAVPVNGTVGILAVNATYYVYIIDFNHNSALEGPGIHFGGFKTALTGGTDVCLVDSYYEKSQSRNGTKYFQMNHWGDSDLNNTNYGGWAGCDARYDILGSTDMAPSGYGSQATPSRVGYDASVTTATNPVTNTLMAALPADLRAVMKPMTKYTDNKGNNSNVAENVTKTIDYFPFLAEFEIFGKRSKANQFEQNYQRQYTYYSFGNSRVKYRHGAISYAASYWERSPCYYAAYTFCTVNTIGSADHFIASRSQGLAPVFKV